MVLERPEEGGNDSDGGGGGGGRVGGRVVGVLKDKTQPIGNSS